MPTKSTERVAQYRQRVKERNKLIDTFIAGITADGGLKYSLTPVAPYPEKDPFKNGIKVSWVMSEKARDMIIAHARKDPALSFDQLLVCLDIRLMKLLLDIGFVQHDWRLEEEEGNNGN